MAAMTDRSVLKVLVQGHASAPSTVSGDSYLTLISVVLRKIR